MFVQVFGRTYVQKLCEFIFGSKRRGDVTSVEFESEKCGVQLKVKQLERSEFVRSLCLIYVSCLLQARSSRLLLWLQA